MHALNCQSKICILMYINVFLNITNIVTHQKIVYRDLGTAKLLKNTSTTEKAKYIYLCHSHSSV